MHKVSRDGVQPSQLNLKAIAECVLPQTYTDVCAFLGLTGHYRWFIKDFACIAQPLTELLTREAAFRKLGRVSLSEDAIKAFDTLKQACMTAPVLAFADYTNPFLPETNASRHGLGVVLSQKQWYRQYHLMAYDSRVLTLHEENYHSTKLELLALKWVVTEHFKEYLPYQPFLVKNDNNPLTYIMMTPNLNATGHQWVGALAMFNFKLEYQKGCDNTVDDVLSWITTCLNPGTVKSILEGVVLGTTQWAKVHNPTRIKGDHSLEQEGCFTAGHTLVQMHIFDWTKTQREDPMLSAVLDWLQAQKKTDMKAILVEYASSMEGQLILQNQQNLTMHQGALYLCLMPKDENEDPLLFVVPKAHWVAALKGCHRDAGHQGQDHTLSLLYKWFWGLGMTNQMQQTIKSCRQWLPHEDTAPWDLLHVNFTSIKTTLELNKQPKVANVFVFQDHFTKHVLAYVTPNQTARTVARFLYQGYISIFGVLARLLSDQYANFMSSVIDELCKILGMNKLCTTPYHPQTNGLVERLHQTLMRMIRKLGKDKKADWPWHLAEIVHAYNATCSAMTGYSPHY